MLLATASLIPDRDEIANKQANHGYPLLIKRIEPTHSMCSGSS